MGSVKRRRVPHGTAITAALTGARTIAMMDGELQAYYTNNYTINLFNGTRKFWNNGSPSGTYPFDSLGYPLNVPNGDTLSTVVMSLPTSDIRAHKIKSGSYVLKWTGGNFTPAFSGSTAVTGLTQPVGGVNRWLLTIGQVTDGTTWEIRLQMLNSTGATASITQGTFVLCHTDHELAWDGGARWNPDYVAYCGTRLAYYRSIKGTAIENSQITTDTAAIHTESHLFWGPDLDAGQNWPTTTGFPHSAVAKLCALLGCDFHCGIPLGASDAVMDVIATQIAGVTAFTGNVMPEVGNENWNNGYKSPLYLTDGLSASGWLGATYAPAHSLNSAAQAEAHISMRAAAAMLRAGISSSRVKLTIALQTAQGFGTPGVALTDPPNASYADLAMYLMDTGNLMGQGATKRYYELCGQVLMAGYSTPNSGAYLGTGSPDSGDLYYGNIQNKDWKNLSDATIAGYFDNGTTETVFWMGRATTYFTALRPFLSDNLKTYEMGHQFVGGHQNNPQLFASSLNTTLSTMIWDTGSPANPSNGDTIRFFTKAPWTTWTEQDYYVRVVDATQARVYTTFAAATATYLNDAAAQAAAITLNNPTGPYYIINYTRCVDAVTRVQVFLDTAPGLALHQRMYASYIGTGKFQVWNQSIGVGSYQFDSARNVLPGLQGTIYHTDSPRKAWFVVQ